MSIDVSDPARTQWNAYMAAFDYFNGSLFGGALPRCILNFSRASRRTFGFFIPRRWESGESTTHEISLNPDILKRPIEATMATLVHEMVHLWQQEYGTPPRNTYHNRQWADKMRSIGLIPSDTGHPGGKPTGYKVSHYIEPDGPFALAYRTIPPDHLLPWSSSSQHRPGKPKDKVKYTCPGCHANVWGKSGLRIVCGECVDVEGQLVRFHSDADRTAHQGALP